MKFTISKHALLKELTFVKGAVETKETIPALGYVLIETVGESAIRLTGTDLDVTARGEADSSVSVQGSFCLPAKRLFEVARSLPNGDVAFSLEDHDRMNIASGRTVIRLAGKPSEDFAQTPPPAPAPLSLSADVFKSFADQVSYAITLEESRFQFAGVKFDFNKERLRMVCTDGHRLAVVERTDLSAAVNGDSVETLIPRKALLLVAGSLCAESGEIRIGADENHIYFESGQRLIASRLLTGQFPAYEMMMPKGFPHRAELDSAELAEAVRRVSLVSESGDVGRSVVLHFTPGTVTVKAAGKDIGEGQEDMQIDYAGDEITTCFTASYLLDALASVDGRAALEFKTAESQFVLKPVAAEFTKTDIVMPRRL